MTPIKFKESNKDLLKPEGMTDAECSSLPVFTDNQQCISQWQLTWKERFQVLFSGKIWLGILSGQTQPPVWLDSSKTIFYVDKIPFRNRLHIKVYPLLKNRKYLSWWWMQIVWHGSLLPFYMDIPFSKYRLAAWNCGNGWKDLRITVRTKDGEWMASIKQGNYKDKKRCSKDFKPFQKDETIDVVGNCANCGVEYHIHKN